MARIFLKYFFYNYNHRNSRFMKAQIKLATLIRKILLHSRHTNNHKCFYLIRFFFRGIILGVRHGILSHMNRRSIHRKVLKIAINLFNSFLLKISVRQWHNSMYMLCSSIQ